MATPIAVLLVEDSEADARLILHCLQRAGFAVVHRRVQDKENLLAAMHEREWDVVISDHTMPEFSGPNALALVRHVDRDIPFIIVSGSVGEESAVETMRAGAHDYVLKHNLARLPAAIERELRDAHERRARKSAEAKIHRMAYYDQLTGLPNRASLLERGERVLREHERETGVTAILLFKIDNMKEINHTLGHSIGEQMIVEASERMRGAARSHDVITMARIGTAELAAVLAADRPQALGAARALQLALGAPVSIEGVELSASVLVGLSLAPENGADIDVLLQRASVALMQASADPAHIACYDQALDPNKPERLAMIADLRRAVELGQLSLHYQPKIHLSTGTITGCEALARWVHPQRGFIPPDRFIPLAEQSGLINPLTRWVLTEAAKQARSWKAAGCSLTVAVNLSAKNFESADITEHMLGLVKDDADLLSIEVTESAVMTDDPRVNALLSRLVAHGIQMSIDDFGTGYSSLTNLRRLPLSEIKIDKSFVFGMDASEEDRIIVRMIIELGHNLGLKVVAEGVETETSLATLTTLQCDIAQGYFHSKPLPADKLTEWMAARGKAGAV